MVRVLCDWGRCFYLRTRALFKKLRFEFNYTNTLVTFKPLVQITGDGFYSVILPSSSNGMPALPEPTNVPPSMLISPPSSETQVQQQAALPLSSIATSVGLIPLPSVSVPVVSIPVQGTPGDSSGQPSTSAASAPLKRPPQKKNNKRKVRRVIGGDEFVSSGFTWSSDKRCRNGEEISGGLLILSIEPTSRS